MITTVTADYEPSPEVLAADRAEHEESRRQSEQVARFTPFEFSDNPGATDTRSIHWQN